MSAQTISPTDLLVLVADQNMLAAVRGLMDRRKSLRVNEVFSFEIFPHPEHDTGCLLRAHEFLGPFQRQYRYAIVMFDRDGCGSTEVRENLEKGVEDRLAAKGWKDRSAVIVLDPELENWVWSNSPHVSESLGWKDRSNNIRDWLRASGETFSDLEKPHRPKEAVERVLRQTKKRRSSALYESLARKVGLASCRDPAFEKFRSVLQAWFPA